MNFQGLFWSVLDEEEPIEALRNVVIALRGKGVEKAKLLEQLESFRQPAADRSEEDEDNVMEVMDYW